MSLFERIFATQAGWAVIALRLSLGVIFFMEGTKKLYGWFDGGGWASTCQYFTQLGVPFPEVTAFFVGYTELLGALGILVGLLTRLAAFGIGCTMVVAILTAHLGGGWEYPLTVLASCIALVFLGAGNLSIDQKISS